MRPIVDQAAELVPVVERVFGVCPRVLDGSSAVLVGDVELSLEAGEREPWSVRVLRPHSSSAWAWSRCGTSRSRCETRERCHG